MRKRKAVRIISLLVLVILFLIGKFLKNANFTPAVPDNKSYVVNYVIDGDTIALSGNQKVRYIGIDTPEIREKSGGEWVYKPRPFAEEAKAFNKKLVEGRAVRLEFDVQKKDGYGRLLAYAYLGDKMVNLEMIKEGYAMIYTYPPNVKYVEKFLEAQKEARIAGKGLWAETDAVISTGEAKYNIGKVKTIEAEVIDTYLTYKMLVLKFRDKFKAVIFKDNLFSLPNAARRSPDSYFKGKKVRIYGMIKDYKGSPEIVLNDLSQIEILPD